MAETSAADSRCAPYATAIGPDGSAYVLYNFDGNGSGERHVGMAKLPPAGSWTSGTPVSPLAFNIGFAGGPFSDPDAIAVWSGQLAGNNLVQAKRWAAGAAAPEAFRDLDQLPSFAQVDQVASDRACSVVADWHTSTERVRAAYDAGPPLLTATVPTHTFAVPGTGKKARKAATKAAKSFKKAGRVLGGKAGKALTDECRHALSAVLGAARRQATALRNAR